MKHTTHTPEAKGPLPAGDYDFEVINAEESVSRKSGADMIELTLTVGGRKMFDRLIFTEKSEWRVDAFLASTGREIVDGEEVEITADDLIGKTGRCRLKYKTNADRSPKLDEKGYQERELTWLWESPKKGESDEKELF